MWTDRHIRHQHIRHQHPSLKRRTTMRFVKEEASVYERFWIKSGSLWIRHMAWVHSITTTRLCWLSSCKYSISRCWLNPVASGLFGGHWTITDGRFRGNRSTFIQRGKITNYDFCIGCLRVHSYRVTVLPAGFPSLPSKRLPYCVPKRWLDRRMTTFVISAWVVFHDGRINTVSDRLGIPLGRISHGPWDYVRHRALHFSTKSVTYGYLTVRSLYIPDAGAWNKPRCLWKLDGTCCTFMALSGVAACECSSILKGHSNAECIV